jgi:hypothetical protein
MSENEEKKFDNSVPYPDAPEPDYDNPNQEHYRGVKDPEIVEQHRKKTVRGK